MACGGVDRLRMARCRPVASAVIRRAQMRAAFDDLPWNFHIGRSGIVAVGLAAAARILRNAAGLCRIRLMLWRIPVGGPFPDVADHVVQPVTVRRECGDRRSALEAVGLGVLTRKFTLPGVGHVTAVRREFIAPRKFGVFKSAARCKFPFRFGRQFLAGPLRVGERVVERHMHDGMIVQPTDFASGSVGMSPIRALGERPPLTEVPEVDRMIGRREHQRARIDHVREYSRIILGVGRNLGDRDVTGSLHELPELPVCHGMAIHPETVDGHAMRGGFFRIMFVRPHAKSAAGYPDHLIDLRGVVANGGVGLEMWLKGKALSSRALPSSGSTKIRSGGGTLSRSRVTFYWTVVQHPAAGPCCYQWGDATTSSADLQRPECFVTGSRLVGSDRRRTSQPDRTKHESHSICDALPLPDRESGIGAAAFCNAAFCNDVRRATVG